MCTAITFRSGANYFGRNLDIERTYNECVTVIPRNYKINLRCLEEVKKHFAIIGMSTIVDNFPLLYDGSNECGLSIAGLNFVGYAKFSEPCESRTNIAGFELPLFILALCESTDDAVKLIKSINITATDFSDTLPCAELHWMIADGKRSVTLEAMDGGIRIHDNPFGVLTNNPPFEYHAANISNYMNLTAHTPINRFSGELELRQYSRGMGAIGLPGDLSSASRFVRAAFVKENSVKPKSEDEAVNQFFHILASVEQQMGCVRLKDGLERTEYSSCCNTDEGIYYYRTYHNSRTNAVKMKNENLDSSELIAYPISQGADVFYRN